MNEFIENLDKNYSKWLENLIQAFSTIDFNSKKNNLDYLSALLVNLTQSKAIRQRLKENDHLKRLLCFTDQKHSIIRRGSVACVLKNCCFDHGLFFRKDFNEKYFFRSCFFVLQKIMNI